MAFLGESPSAAGVPAAPRDWQAGLPLQPSSHTPGEAGSPLTAQGMNWCSPVENSSRVPARPLPQPRSSCAAGLTQCSLELCPGHHLGMPTTRPSHDTEGDMRWAHRAAAWQMSGGPWG